jgi:hypothetical protein
MSSLYETAPLTSVSQTGLASHAILEGASRRLRFTTLVGLRTESRKIDGLSFIIVNTAKVVSFAFAPGLYLHLYPPPL